MWGVVSSSSPKQRTFLPEFHPRLNHNSRGTVSLATVPSTTDPDQRLAGSQYLITLGDNLNYMDGKAAVFGYVAEGFDTLERINTAFIDQSGRPLKDIRIRHTIIIDEAGIPDPPGLVEPPHSPVPTPAQLATVRIAEDEELAEDADQEAVEKLRREREARAQALTLEMVGDLPFAEVAPPENVLFICKLNPVTRDEDLEIIFGRFGKIMSCEVIRDMRTEDSLQYAFIEFAERQMCEQAYFKMQDVLIDDHRIHVDFSQSVSRLADSWRDASNKKRKTHVRGGFGGIEGLEKKTQYRDEPRHQESGGYGMVYGEQQRTGKTAGGGLARQDRCKRSQEFRSRSKSPRRRRDPSRNRLEEPRGHRGRPSRERYRNDFRHRSPGRHRDHHSEDYGRHRR